MNGTLQENQAAPTSKRLCDLKAGEDYLELKYLPGKMPDHLFRLEFLKACERLDIPKDKWPTFDGTPLVLPDGATQLPGTSTGTPKTLGIGIPPLIVQFEVPYDIGADDHRTFSKKIDSYWHDFRKKSIGPYLKGVTKTKRLGTQIGLFRPRKGHREGMNLMPVSLRYELAARRYCLGSSWGRLRKVCGGQYSEDRIRKCVEAVLTEVGLKTRN